MRGNDKGAYETASSRIKLIGLEALLILLMCGGSVAEDIAAESLPDDFTPRPRKQALALDVYRQNIHQELTHFLRGSERLRHVRRGKTVALDVNGFDEVPDSVFFVNRHGRERLSSEQLRQGPGGAGAGGPKPGEWKVVKGKNTGLSRGMFIEDSERQRYLLKFDPEDNLELSTGSESVSSRMFHAIGYNVPEYHVTYFTRDQLKAAPGAKYYARSGFKKSLTEEGIDEILERVPLTSDGKYRASASKIISGEVLGRIEYDTRRKQDPNDPIWHRDRRGIRALRVFASWVNYYDLVPQNSLEVIQEIDGKRVIKHYIIDFGSSLGGAGYLVKPDMYGFENMFDYGEIFKSLLSLGFYKKSWQKRADALTVAEMPIASVGNFDNKEFDPGTWKTQLPAYAFKELTDADAFWAAKIIMQFTDEDIRAIVESGEYSDKTAIDYLSGVLAERRDMIGKYWFEQVSPLGELDASAQGGNLTVSFVDLAEKYGFVSAQETSYRFEVFERVGKKGKEKLIASGEVDQAPITLGQGQWNSSGKNRIAVSAKHGQSGKWLPPVSLEISEGHLTSIKH